MQRRMLDNTLTAGMDEFYTHDGLDRLIGVNRGTLNGTQTAVSTLAFAQEWGLDALGNWSSFKQDDNGDGTADLDQARAHNKANEIGSIGQSPDPTGRGRFPERPTGVIPSMIARAT